MTWQRQVSVEHPGILLNFTASATFVLAHNSTGAVLWR